MRAAVTCRGGLPFGSLLAMNFSDIERFLPQLHHPSRLSRRGSNDTRYSG